MCMIRCISFVWTAFHRKKLWKKVKKRMEKELRTQLVCVNINWLRLQLLFVSQVGGERIG